MQEEETTEEMVKEIVMLDEMVEKLVIIDEMME